MQQPHRVRGQSVSQLRFQAARATQRFSPIESATSLAPLPPKPPLPHRCTWFADPQTGISYQLGSRTLARRAAVRSATFLNDMTVSREHAVVAPDGDGFAITDSHSFNGVWVNNETVERHHLQNGDIIQIGVFCLLFKEEAAN